MENDPVNTNNNRSYELTREEQLIRAMQITKRLYDVDKEKYFD